MGAKASIWVQRVAAALGAIVGVVLVAALPIPPWIRLATLTVGVVLAVGRGFRRVPAFDPLGRVRWRLHRDATGRKVCALTFDDGPSPSTSATLDILAAALVPATFFVVGANAERHPDVVRRMAAEGHAVGLHGLNHTKLDGAPDAEVERQVAGVAGVLARLGVTPAPIYRTPHGFKSRAVFAVARRHGLALWAWSRGIWDTDRPSPAILVRRATRWSRSGMVLLLHDGHDEDREPDVRPMMDALPEIIGELQRRGFSFVRLTDA